MKRPFTIRITKCMSSTLAFFALATSAMGQSEPRQALDQLQANFEKAGISLEIGNARQSVDGSLELQDVKLSVSPFLAEMMADGGHESQDVELEGTELWQDDLALKSGSMRLASRGDGAVSVELSDLALTAKDPVTGTDDEVAIARGIDDAEFKIDVIDGRQVISGSGQLLEFEAMELPVDHSLASVEARFDNWDYSVSFPGDSDMLPVMFAGKAETFDLGIRRLDQFVEVNIVVDRPRINQARSPEDDGGLFKLLKGNYSRDDRYAFDSWRMSITGNGAVVPYTITGTTGSFDSRSIYRPGTGEMVSRLSGMTFAVLMDGKSMEVFRAGTMTSEGRLSESAETGNLGGEVVMDLSDMSVNLPAILPDLDLSWLPRQEGRFLIDASATFPAEFHEQFLDDPTAPLALSEGNILVEFNELLLEYLGATVNASGRVNIRQDETGDADQWNPTATVSFDVTLVGMDRLLQEFIDRDLVSSTVFPAIAVARALGEVVGEDAYRYLLRYDDDNGLTVNGAALN